MHRQHFYENSRTGMIHAVNVPKQGDYFATTACGVRLTPDDHVHTNPETAVNCKACIYEVMRDNEAPAETNAELWPGKNEDERFAAWLQLHAKDEPKTLNQIRAARATEQAKNPKHAAGKAKQPFHQVPPIALKYLADAMAHGASKYGAYNFSEAGVVASIYYDAMTRHKLAWFTGEDIDAESGIPHIALMMACGAILLECITKGNLDDDRPKHTSAVCHTRPHPLAGDPIEQQTFGPLAK